MTSTTQLPEKYIGSGKERRMNPEFVALWGPYLDEGLGYKHVADIFGVHRTTVSREYPGRGWTHQQSVEMGAYVRHHNEKMRKLQKSY